MANRLKDLAEGLAAFFQDLDSRMADVVLVTMSEFGRTVRENGNRGTDHGHANAMFSAHRLTNPGIVMAHSTKKEVGKMITRQIAAVMGSLMLASLLASAAVADQGFPRGGGKGRGHLWSALQLSEDQRAHLKNIFANSRESIRPLREQLREKRAALREATAASPFDEGRVRSLAQELSSVQTELIVQRARLMNEALGILTSEQRAKLEELRQQRQQRFKEWRERRRSNPDKQQG